uniref:Uncharacterized protein n=1 Tax=Phaeomonas parva TaxID=124430 RepID=A0A7S1UH52_9STRA|mmetsp:Transcript_5632/g.15731  ORF Transcript_5632/g.15731 Transcript_5632/m.15731 type:complete len:263 (+) Transcript_5632:378-1166(+)
MADDIRASVGGWKLTPVTVEAIESRAGEKTFVVAAQRSAFWAGIASAALCLALCHQLSSLCYQTSVVCDYAVDDGGAAATAEGSPLTCEVWRSNLLQPAASWRRNYTVESWRDFRVIAIGRNQDCRFEHPAQLTYPRAMALPFFPELVPQSFMHRMALSGTTWALLVPHTARNAAWADEDDADPAGAAPFDRYYVRDADEGFVLARPYSRRSFRKVEQFWGDLMRHFGREPSEGMRVRYVRPLTVTMKNTCRSRETKPNPSS